MRRRATGAVCAFGSREESQESRLARRYRLAADIGFREESSVDGDFDDEKDGKNPDLENDFTEARKSCRPFDAMTGTKSFALHFGLVEAATQPEQLIAADGGLRSKIPNRLGSSLLNGREALFEAQGRNAIVVGVNVVEVNRVRCLLMRLDPFNNLMLNVVQGLGICGRAVLRTAFLASSDKPQFVGNAIDIQVKKDGSRRTILV